MQQDCGLEWRTMHCKSELGRTPQSPWQVLVSGFWQVGARASKVFAKRDLFVPQLAGFDTLVLGFGSSV